MCGTMVLVNTVEGLVLVVGLPVVLVVLWLRCGVPSRVDACGGRLRWGVVVM